MQPIPLSLDSGAPRRFAVWQLGFRPFFLAASIWAVIAVSLWLALYPGWLAMPLSGLPPMVWHAHEMIFGYTLAVAAGFLLTAVRNWTGVQTWQGWRLAALVVVWALARVLLLLGSPRILPLTALIDVAFLGLLIVAVTAPVVRVRQWKQIGIVAKLVLLLGANVMFYLGAAGKLADGVNWGLYSGLYFLLGLVFVMGRRVIPFFIERGVDANDVRLKNWLWLDISSLVLFLLFWVFDVFLPAWRLTIAGLSAILLILHGLRLWGWHHPGIWRKPLLWSLYLAYGFLTLGFGLKAGAELAGWSPFLALHAFAYGGIGLVTMGMMARVSLGHTGRNVFDPPRVLGPIFLLLIVGAVVRVLLPLVLSQYGLLILVSQICWIAGFGLFLVYYLPILLKPRVDGRPG